MITEGDMSTEIVIHVDAGTVAFAVIYLKDYLVHIRAPGGD